MTSCLIREVNGENYPQLKKMSEDTDFWRCYRREWSSAATNRRREWSTNKWINLLAV